MPHPVSGSALCGVIAWHDPFLCGRSTLPWLLDTCTPPLFFTLIHISQPTLLGVSQSYISLGDIRFPPTPSEFAIFRGYFNFWSNAAECCYLGRDTCVLFEVCEKRSFQKCMGWGMGVGGHSFEHRAVNETPHMTRQCSRDHSFFRIRVVVMSLLPLSTRAGTPLGHTSPCLLLGTYFLLLQFFPILQPACLHWHPPCVQGHGPQAVSSSWEHAGCCYLAESRVTFTKFAPQSALFCAPKVSVVHQGKQQHIA